MTLDSLYSSVKPLPLRVEALSLGGNAAAVGGNYTRRTTYVTLTGGGFEGCGEDVTWEEPDQLAFQNWVELPDLSGEWTFDSFSQHLDSLTLFPEPPLSAGSKHYRRWAFESAALDLALSQSGIALQELLRLSLEPLTFVASMRLESEKDLQRLLRVHELHPSLGFKLDPMSVWSEKIWQAVRSLGTVQVLDLKGQYVGTPVDQGADPGLYQKVVEHFPSVWIEDPALTSETIPILEPVADRVTWDAPIQSVEDIRSLRWKPRGMNIKPSRFGSLQSLLATYEYCSQEGIAMYGGGQAELGRGRLQVQHLASLFHAEAGNDVAPSIYNEPEVEISALPPSPLDMAGGGIGFPPR